MATRTAPIRRIEAPPYVADMTKLETFGEVAEVLRSSAFRQGSHQESQPFSAGSLLVLDGTEHFHRRRLESVLFSKDALLYYEKRVLQPAIERVMDEVARDRDDDGNVTADVVSLTRRMLLEMTARSRAWTAWTPPRPRRCSVRTSGRWGRGPRSSGRPTTTTR